MGKNTGEKLDSRVFYKWKRKYSVKKRTKIFLWTVRQTVYITHQSSKIQNMQINSTTQHILKS